MSLLEMGQLSICGVELPPPAARSRKIKQTTRGDYYGIKAAPLARVSIAKIAKIKSKIEKLQEPWAEADPMIESATDAVLKALDDLIEQYQGSADYLNEPMDA